MKKNHKTQKENLNNEIVDMDEKLKKQNENIELLKQKYKVLERQKEEEKKKLLNDENKKIDKYNELFKTYRETLNKYNVFEHDESHKEVSELVQIRKEFQSNLAKEHQLSNLNECKIKYETLEKRIEKLRNELLSYGYEYISGYQKYNSLIRIKDLSNGIEYNVNCHNFIQRKRNNKISEHYEPTRDRKITLRGLYKNFNGICYICGEKCDFSDWHINENGTRCFGGNYPSIEHLIPRSRGGKTEWKNAPKRVRTVSRTYGGVLSGGAVRHRIMRAFFNEEL